MILYRISRNRTDFLDIFHTMHINLGGAADIILPLFFG